MKCEACGNYVRELENKLEIYEKALELLATSICELECKVCTFKHQACREGNCQNTICFKESLEYLVSDTIIEATKKVNNSKNT